MDVEKKKYQTPENQLSGEPGSPNAPAHSIIERGAEACGKAEQSIGDVYDKTAKAVGETYEQAKRYSRKNPDKAILIALGIGVGLGFLFGASSRHSRTGRIARPVVNALSDIALEFFR
jgi:ElaB/YqjD/DUF883 family membrane-anchored ribosome-binding protein